MMVMTISEARAALPEVLNRVEAGEDVTITRHGKPVAMVVRPDVMWHRGAAAGLLDDARRLEDLLAGAATEPVPAAEGEPAAGLSEQRAEELIAALRASRERG